ncbi:MAG: hypothetical protein ACYCXT_07040 [Acidiferrobacteraceae bacterium]
MSVLSSIYHKVCPACAAMRPREDPLCLCGHSFENQTTDPELAEEQLYEHYLRARMQQIQQALRNNEPGAKAAEAALTRQVKMRTETELKAVQAELDRQRARIERMRRAARPWAEAGRSEAPRVVEAAQALAKELAGLRRGREGETFAASIAANRIEARATHPKEAPVSAPTPDDTTVLQNRSEPAATAGVAGHATPEHIVADAPGRSQDIAKTNITPDEPQGGAEEQAQTPIETVSDAPQPTPTANTTFPAPASLLTLSTVGVVSAEAPADVRTLLAVEAERVVHRQEQETLIECPNCTAMFPKSQTRCNCGFEQMAASTLMPSVTLDAGERSRLGSLVKPD